MSVNLIRTIQNGYLLEDTIPPLEDLLDAIETVVGISGIKANSAFHKSWKIIQESDLESLITQQIIHYITTYGFERLGIYREDAVYIPKEILELPAISDDIPLVVIKAMTAEEILEQIIKFEWWDMVKDKTQQALDIVINSIVEDVKKNVEGKIIYIPNNIHYALPATEKQFTGYFPTGTYVTTTEDMIVGIHWTNTKKNRVDLDLSVMGESGKIGWDADYYSTEKEVLFSGDMTDAPPPHGASELFYLKQAEQEARILMVNYFNFVRGEKVEAKILVAQEKPDNFKQNYMVNVNKIIASANITIDKIQNILGIIANINNENRVYFANISLGNSITSSYSYQSMKARHYLVSKLVNSLDFREILTMAGAKIIDKIPDKKEEEYINLSPVALDKNTIINLIRGC